MVYSLICSIKNFFYKYYKVDSAILTLERGTQRWSNPIEFNDPFDAQFDFYFEEHDDEVIDRLFENYYSKLLNSNINVASLPESYAEPLKKIQSTDPLLRSIVLGQNKSRLQNAIRAGLDNIAAKLPPVRETFKKILEETSVFCVSETHDNILMWSHYAKDHKGIVIKFLTSGSINSPLQLAKPVIYSKDFPRMRYEDFFNIEELGTGAQGERIRDMLTLTKSDMWSYEKEWRIISELRDKTQTVEYHSFTPQEVGAIYLGCKMETINKQRIIEITRAKYPLAKIYEAVKNPMQFSLDFIEII